MYFLSGWQGRVLEALPLLLQIISMLLLSYDTHYLYSSIIQEIIIQTKNI